MFGRNERLVRNVRSMCKRVCKRSCATTVAAESHAKKLLPEQHGERLSAQNSLRYTENYVKLKNHKNTLQCTGTANFDNQSFTAKFVVQSTANMSELLYLYLLSWVDLSSDSKRERSPRQAALKALTAG